MLLNDSFKETCKIVLKDSIRCGKNISLKLKNIERNSSFCLSFQLFRTHYFIFLTFQHLWQIILQTFICMIISHQVLMYPSLCNQLLDFCATMHLLPVISYDQFWFQLPSKKKKSLQKSALFGKSISHKRPLCHLPLSIFCVKLILFLSLFITIFSMVDVIVRPWGNSTSH